MVATPADDLMELLCNIADAYPRNPACSNLETFVVKMRDVFLPAIRTVRSQNLDSALVHAGMQPAVLSPSPRSPARPEGFMPPAPIQLIEEE